MINSSGDVNLIELNNAIQYIQEIAGKDAKIMWGTVSSEEQLNDNKNSVITIIATGLENVSASKSDSNTTYDKAYVPKHDTKNIYISNSDIPVFDTLKNNAHKKETELVIPAFLQSRMR